jgi:hypothetical protein
MVRTAANIVAHQQFYRMGIAGSAVTVMCDAIMGILLYGLLKPVNRRLALIGLVFFAISVTIEAVNIFNYMSPLLTLTTPEYRTAFSSAELQALVRGAKRLWAYGFSVALVFFSVSCFVTGYLVFRSGFLPAILGALMMIAGLYYLTDNFSTFLGLPGIPYIGALQPTLVAESALALWLVGFGVNDAKWRARTELLRVGLETHG